MNKVEVGMAFNGRRQFGINGPANGRVGKGLTNHGKNRQRLDYVAQRAESHYKYFARLGWQMEPTNGEYKGNLIFKNSDLRTPDALRARLLF